MIEKVLFTSTAEKDLKEHRKSGNQSILRKISSLVKAIKANPYEGIGKPEQLKHDLTGYWSRRINQEHRIIYEIDEDESLIIVHSVKGHYGDK